MPQTNGERRYTKYHAERYVHLLGCWTFMNPTDVIKRRDPNDYKELLQKLIEANKTRSDMAGKWETEAALDELKKLSKVANPHK